MKKLLMLLAIVAGSFTAAQAQPNKTITIKTPTVQCESCKTRIQNMLAREEGIVRSTVDFKRKTTKVTYYTERTNPENIKTAIANAGYDADDVTANDESYQKLPKCCKKPEDGGGMEKKQ